MASDITLRTAVPGDAEVIAAVHLRAFREAYESLLPPAHLAQMTRMRRIVAWRHILARSRPPEHTLVATRPDGGTVGFVNGGPSRRESAGFTGEIYTLYLLAAHQKTGIGRRLFAASARYLALHGYDRLHLWALADGPASGFYSRMGGVEGETCLVGPAGQALEEVVYRWRLPFTSP